MIGSVQRLVLGVLAAIALLAPGARAGSHSQAEVGAGPGAQLWRAGDRAAAAELWRETLVAGSLEDAERARLAYNLGVAAHQDEDPLLAVAWWTACLRIDPRHGDARANLGIAREDAELGSANGDGPAGALLGWARSFTRAEAEWLALLAAGLVLLGGVLEAARGRAMRPVLALALLGALVLWTPLCVSVLDHVPAAHMVIEPSGLRVYPMPEASVETLGELQPGDVVEALDRLPGWQKVNFEGAPRWVREAGLMELDV